MTYNVRFLANGKYQTWTAATPVELNYLIETIHSNGWEVSYTWHS